MTNRYLKLAAPLLVILLVGCASHRSYRLAQISEQEGNWRDAVVHYMAAVEDNPTNLTYRASLLRAKVRASQQHFKRGRDYHEGGFLERALIEYQQAVQLDPTNQYAQVELEKVRDEVRARQTGQEPRPTMEEMKRRTHGVRPQPPTLNPRSDEPISLHFPEKVSILDIYKALSQAFGINILFDPNLRDQEIAVELVDVTAQDALEILMRAAGHFYKPLDEHSIIVAADTPQNRRTYEDLVIQTFFLSNADVRDVLTMLRSLLGARNVTPSEQLNAIIIRDTVDKVKVAERIIQATDKSRAEVVIDVELIQVDTTRLRELGVSLDSFSVVQSLDVGREDGTIRLSDLENLNQSHWSLTVPNFIYDFVRRASDSQLLANPTLRISEGERARLHIGDRVPIPTTTFSTGQTIGGNIVPITSFQYQEVGIRIEIEPRVHHNREITLQLKVEVSNISTFVEGPGGQRQPIIGTRTIESTIRLKDGETNLLAGLIRSDETVSDTGFPGLADIPILGRLFSRSRTDNQRSDVVLTMTPHIIRVPDVTEEDLLPIWVGTEANISFRGGSPRVEAESEGPFEVEEGTPEQIQEMMRRRLQQLPRGLREAVEEGAPEERRDEEAETPRPEPPGEDLVPPQPFPDFFREEEDEPRRPGQEPPPDR